MKSHIPADSAPPLVSDPAWVDEKLQGGGSCSQYQKTQKQLHVYRSLRMLVIFGKEKKK